MRIFEVRWCFLVFLSLLLCCPALVFPQVHNEIFSKLSVEDGLSSVTVTCVLKDSRGYVWIGTADGLNRYNGYEFKIYRNDPSKKNGLRRNYINAIKEDSEGTLWVSTGGGGLHYYDRKMDEFISVSPYDQATINMIKEDRNGRVWFVGNAIYAYDIKKNRWTDYSTRFPDLWQSAIAAIEQESNDEFWIASTFKLYRWNIVHHTFKAYDHDDQDPNTVSVNHFYDLLKDNSGNLWIATRAAGLDKLEVATGKFTHFRPSPDREKGPLVDVIRTLCLDGKYLWLGTENGGLSKLDTQSGLFQHYYHEKEFPNGINDNSIWTLYKDDEGRLWIGTFSFGLCVLDPYENKFSTLKVVFENTTVNAILKDRQQRLWIGTEGGVVMVKDDKVSYYLNKSNAKSKAGIPILTIHEDYDGRIWVGTWNEGVYRFDDKSNSFVQFASGGNNKHELTNPNNYAILQTSRNDEILIASYNGLNIVTRNFERDGFVKLIDSIGNYIRILYEDSKGNIWVGSRTEVRMYNATKKTLAPVCYTNDDPEKNLRAAVSCMHEDRKGRMWIGSEAGLYCIENQVITARYTINNGLANQDIRGILEDKAGNLWISTSIGITFFNADKKIIKNYDASDGLFANGFKHNSSFKDHDGFFYFGGSDGVVMFDPLKIADNPFTPKVMIEDLKIFNQPVRVGASDSILHQQIGETRKITLDYNSNILTIDYVSLNYSASNKNQYAYLLEGFDTKWNYVGNSRSATYTNLDPGTYTFKLKASNNDGIWSEPAEKLSIVILPPWWKTAWAYAAYAVMVFIMLYFFRKFILMRAHFVHDIRMERMKLENVEKLNKAKLDFFTNISHEFRTPLTIIMGLIENMSESRSVDNMIRSKLQAANKNAARLLRLVNELLDFRKAESGAMKLRVTEVNIVSFVREVKLSFEPLAEEKKISFSFHASADDIFVWIDADQFEKVIVNLLSNAFKNTTEGGEVSIQIRNNLDNVVISVQDNGKGIQPQYLSSIFQTFFSHVDGESSSSGTGIGLALTKTLVELHHGRIEVDSIPGKLTRFSITLPPGNAHFSASQVVFQNEESEILKDQLDVSVDDSVADLIGGETERHQRRLLIVEDNDEVRALVVSLFSKHYSVLEAKDGVQGAEIALAEIPDIIISDVMMPRKDGITLCKELKSNVNTSHIPVILLTARTSLVFQVEGLETGADDYITKPFSSKLLQLKVRNILQLRDRIQKMFTDTNVLSVEPSAVAVTPRDQVFMEKVLKSVEDNMSNLAYSVDDMCRDVAMSKTSLFRKLKALTGQSANEFIRTIRLKRAAQLLPQHQLSIAEIAYAVGFSDPKYFRVRFKQLFKVSPSEFSNREETVDQ